MEILVVVTIFDVRGARVHTRTFSRCAQTWVRSVGQIGDLLNYFDDHSVTVNIRSPTRCDLMNGELFLRITWSKDNEITV